jgi:uncharacterized protein (TIRG00374 family)
MRPYVRWLLRLIGPALLIYFLATSGVGEIARILGDLNLGWLLLSLALFPAFVAVKSWRWNVLMSELNLQTPPLLYSMTLYMIGLFLGGTTPGQSGDFVKAWYLRERGQPLAPVLFSILLDRLFDFLVMALLALLGLLVFIELFPREIQPIVVAAALLFILGTPVLMARRPRDWLMTRALPLLPARVRALIERWRGQFATLTLRPALLARLLLMSAASASITILRIYVLFLALDLTAVPVLAVIASTALVALLQTLPISIAGLGVRDAILIPVLALYGYSQEQALSLSALFLVVNIEHIVVGFLLSLRYPLGRAQTPPAPEVAERVQE